jgi:23S rRNA (adenine2503-C2)-methyltransferase
VAQTERFCVIGATREEVHAFFDGLGEPAYRADQVLRWAYAAGASSFEAMSNLPNALRAALNERCTLYTTSVAEARDSCDGTRKLLVALCDGEAVETVVIPEGRRRTACISTQVGCAVRCAFCASGLCGWVRNLSAGEIVEQALHARREARSQGGLTNVVVMGIGEPLANYDALVRALRILAAPWGMALSPRRITVSTVGLPSRIRRLAGEGLDVNLAVSLHAADDLTRRRLIPRARPLREVVCAARHYLRTTGREVTFEYVVIKDVNDSPTDARGLAELVGKEDILVNLLAVNRVAGLPWEKPPEGRVERFMAELRRRGVRVQQRRRRGADIEGACGQLRHRRRSRTPDETPDGSDSYA